VIVSAPGFAAAAISFPSLSESPATPSSWTLSSGNGSSFSATAGDGENDGIGNDEVLDIDNDLVLDSARTKESAGDDVDDIKPEREALVSGGVAFNRSLILSQWNFKSFGPLCIPKVSIHFFISSIADKSFWTSIQFVRSSTLVFDSASSGEHLMESLKA